MRKRIFSLAVLSIALSAPMAGEPMPSLSVTCALPGSSIASWQAGDRLMVWHDGVVYDYVTAQSGDEVMFRPSEKVGAEADAFNPAKPLNVYFNVDAVTGRGEAVFSIKAEQKGGELSGRLPQWGRVEPGTELKLRMAPLCTVIQLNAYAAESFRVDRLVLLPQSTATGFTAVSGARINPQTGKLTLPRQVARPVSIGVSTSGADLAAHPVFSVMVAGVNPGNPGLVADFFKGRINNMRSVILPGKDAGKDSGPATINIDLGEKKVGIASAAEFEDFALGMGRGDKHGLKYCNEDGVVCLKADIDMSAIKDWSGIKDLRADFDGKSHTIYGYRISRPGSAAIFVSTAASVRNVNFGRPGDFIEVNGGGFSLAAPIAMTTNPNAVVEGCVNRSELRSTPACSGSVFVGGIVGRSTASIINCANLGKVTMDSPSSSGVKYSGGIAGNIVGDMGTVSNSISSCVNRGEVSSTTSEKAWVGGIAGRISENAKVWTVEKCTNKGKVSISSTVERVAIMSFIGGIVAEMARPVSYHGGLHQIRDCRNSGPVFTNADGRISMGGIAGLTRMTVIEHCINAAEITHLRGLESDESLARNYVNMGGIVGLLSLESSAIACENTAIGAVSSYYSVAHRLGGIAGNSNRSVIKQCSNSAPINLKLMRKASAVCAVGGICGMQDGSSGDLISACSNSGEVSLAVNVTGLNAVAGGILAVLARGGVQSCKNSGNVTAINELALPDMNCIAGGVAGRVYKNDVSGVKGCSNTGHVVADAPYSPSKGLISAGESVGHYD